MFLKLPLLLPPYTQMNESWRDLHRHFPVFFYGKPVRLGDWQHHDHHEKSNAQLDRIAQGDQHWSTHDLQYGELVATIGNRTLLNWACFYNNEAVLDHGYSLVLEHHSGNSAFGTTESNLYWAVACRQSIKLIGGLIQEIVMQTKGYPLHHNLFLFAIHCGAVDAVKYLFDQKLIFNSPLDPEIYLFELLKNGKLELFQFFIEGRHLDLNGLYADMGLLHLAVIHGRLDLVHYLCNQPMALIDITTPTGVTPLILACSKGKLDIIQTLVASGADINRADQYGETPLSVAAKSGAKEVVNYLLEQGAHCASINALVEEVRERGYDDIADALLIHTHVDAELNNCSSP